MSTFWQCHPRLPLVVCLALAGGWLYANDAAASLDTNLTPTPTVSPDTTSDESTAVPPSVTPTSTPTTTATPTPLETSTGWVSPSLVPHSAFALASDAFGDEGGAATRSGSNTTQRFGGYDFAVPDTAAVIGIQVRADAWQTAGECAPILNISLSPDAGLSYTSSLSTGPLLSNGDPQGELLVGGAHETWGRAWTAAEINTAFLLRLQTSGLASGCTLALDWVPIAVHYAAPTDSPTPTPAALATEPVATSVPQVTASEQAMSLPEDTPMATPTAATPTAVDTFTATPAVVAAITATLTATPLPGGVLLNEFLPHPRSDWDASGASNAKDEFVELANVNAFAVDLTGYGLDDAEGGSKPYVIPASTTLLPGELRPFFRSETRIALNDDGDTVRLLGPQGQVLDSVTYERDPGADVSWVRQPDASGEWHDDGLPSPGDANERQLPTATPTPKPGRGAQPTPEPVGVAEFRAWPDGAWAVVEGRVTVLPSVLSPRLIVVQDGSGGVPIYLGRGTWPTLTLGQAVSALGYLRTRSGQRELYMRNAYHFHTGVIEEIVAPSPVQTGSVADALEGWLVVLEGQVVRVESSAFWLDDGSGPARVFFGSGVKRPSVQRGQTWRVTGVVTEYTPASAHQPGYRVRVRVESDAVRVEG